MTSNFVANHPMDQKKVINLRQARKSKQRAEKRVEGNNNAVKFGRTKIETDKIKALESLDDKRLDGHKLDK
jgi:hypothetical protein